MTKAIDSFNCKVGLTYPSPPPGSHVICSEGLLFLSLTLKADYNTSHISTDAIYAICIALEGAIALITFIMNVHTILDLSSNKSITDRIWGSPGVG